MAWVRWRKGMCGMDNTQPHLGSEGRRNQLEGCCPGHDARVSTAPTLNEQHKFGNAERGTRSAEWPGALLLRYPAMKVILAFVKMGIGRGRR